MKRIVSCFTNCYGSAGVRVAVEKIGNTGINHLELALRGHNFGGLVIPEEVVVTEQADHATVKNFLELLKNHRVSISACNVGGGDIRTDEGTALTERRMRFAKKWFGVPVVVSGASQPETPQERRAVIENLRKLGDLAKELDLVIALETHQGPTQNADEMLTLMFEVHHDRVQLNFDTANILYYNDGVDVYEQLDRVKTYVKNVHIKDSRGQKGDWFFPAVGDGGAIDFSRIRSILDGVGFQGPYGIEIEGIGGEPDPGLEGRQDRIKRSVDHLRTCGFFD